MVRIFDSIDKDVLAMLGPEKAVELLHKLVYAELNHLKVASGFVSIPLKINTPDGGIDGTTIIDGEVTGSELIFSGTTYYQVKSGKNVKYTGSGLKNIVCGKPGGNRGKELKPKIRDIVEEDGTFVLFFPSKSDPGAEDAEKNLSELLKTYCPQTAIEVRIIQADNVIGILDRYLPIRVWLRGGRLEFPGKLFDEWSSEPLMSNAFKTDEKRDRIIKNIRMLAQSTNPEDKVIRISGFPGNGKTRSVLEALRGSGLEPLVIYFEKPSDMIGARYHCSIARSNDHTVVIVDECDPQSHNQLAEAFAHTGSRVTLITIYNESGYPVAPAKYVDINEDEVLDEKTISEIMKSYGIPEYEVRRWSSLCEGSPRVAHMIAENLSTGTGDMLRNPSYDSAMERFLANKDDLNGENFKRRKKILSWLSLFKRCGWSKEFSEERNFIIGIIRSKTSYSEDDIIEVVNDLKQRKILQGERTLYISPRLLHVRAWVWWWEAYKDVFDFHGFRCVKYEGKELIMPDQLYSWFTEMFKYAHGVAGASKVVKDLLAIDGPLSNEPRLLEALNDSFFLNLTTADPENSLLFLERWFSEKTDDDIRVSRRGRMNLVRCLERIAVWKSLFARAAKLLLRIAATEEDHTYSNNSEGIFANLFSNGWGKTAYTEAPPALRYPVMEKAVKSTDPRYIRMGLAAISQALQSMGFTRSVGAEIQGLREEPKLWRPKTWGEFFDAIQAAWDLLLNVLPSLEGDLRKEALEVVNYRIRGGLLISGSPYDIKYLNDYAELVKNGTVPFGQAVDTVNGLRRNKGDFTPEVTEGLNKLSKYLDSGDIDALLERYVKNNSLEDWVPDEDRAKSTSRLTEISRSIINDPRILSDNVWLFTKQAINSYWLGQKLSELDTDMSLLDPLCRFQKESGRKNPETASCALLAGYLVKVSQGDNGRWQGILSRIENDPALVRWYAEICSATNFDDRNADTILRLIQEGKLEKTELEKFRWGGLTKKISHVAFERWIEFLLACNDVRSVNTAITLFYQHYISKKNYPIPQDLGFRLLTSETLLTEGRGSNENSMRDYYWKEIAGRYIAQHPDGIDGLAEFIIKNFSRGRGVFNIYNEYANKLMYTLIPKNPEKIWEFIGQQLEKENFNYPLKQWLSGSIPMTNRKTGIKLFPKDLVFSWIAENPSERAPIIAGIVPGDFDIEPTEGSWFKDMLNRYGDDENVQNALVDSGSAVISGTISDYYAAKLERIRRFGELNEDSDNIQTWVAKACGALQWEIDWARMQEERRDY